MQRGWYVLALLKENIRRYPNSKHTAVVTISSEKWAHLKKLIKLTEPELVNKKVNWSFNIAHKGN